jgi:glutamyl-tRNA reductase
MQLACISFHHIKTRYDNFQKVRFEDPERFYELSFGERVLLQTGTRIEVYAYVREVDSLLGMFASKSGLTGAEIEEFFDVYYDDDATLHLFRMSGSVESRVLGETYIPLAIESAFLLAKEKGGVGPLIKELFKRAILIGERARAETKIDGSASVADIAVKSILKELPKIEGKKVVLLGAGTTGRKIAEELSNYGVELIVVNRNQDIGQITAQKVGGTLLEYSKLTEVLSNADVLICSTLASHYRVLPEMIAHRTLPLVIVDVSPFRNVSPEVTRAPGVILINREIEKAVSGNHKTAKSEISNVDKIIHEEILSLKGIKK